MSKLLYVCCRNKPFSESTEKKLTDICNELVPDNIQKSPQHKTCVKNNLAYAVTMNNKALLESEMSLCLGVLYENTNDAWMTPGNDYPDGNFILIRNTIEEIEVVSDFVGSRTIWYFHDDELFIASTSQRAITMFLGSFEFDKRVIPWMLSTGSLGPIHSWDKRIQRLQIDSSVFLNKKTWTLYVNQNPVSFSEKNRDKHEHQELLTQKISQTINHLKSLDFKYWVLPLSGGYDSRAILCFIKQQLGIPEKFKTVTWGLESSLKEKGNDAQIANRLANSLNVKNDYFTTDISNEPAKAIIDRFILCSEGRIDHLAGYMDGMEIWRKFHDNNIFGVIRGDEGFGWTSELSDYSVRQSVGCLLCSDFENLKSVIQDYNLSPQELPPNFKKTETETFGAWRDRLYHCYRIPTVLAALSDIKFSYVEQINPLLSKSILTTVRTMPDNLRSNKSLFREIVNKLEPNIPIANKGANDSLFNILRKNKFNDLLKHEIDSDSAKLIFGSKFVKIIMKGIENEKPKAKNKKTSIKKRISFLIPQQMKNLLRKKVFRPRVDNYLLAFRVFIICRMHKTLAKDSQRFGH